MIDFDLKEVTDGKWMRGADIGIGETLVVTIASGGKHVFERTGETKAYLSFSDHHQNLTVGPERGKALRALLGDDKTTWPGRQIGLRRGRPFQGQPSIDVVEPPNYRTGNGVPAAPSSATIQSTVFAAARENSAAQVPPAREYSDREAPAEQANPTW